MAKLSFSTDENYTKMTRTMSFPGTATDLYELTMAAGYHAHGRNERATFELFVRKFPAHRSFLIAAGLAQAVDYLQHLSFSAQEIEYLKALPIFSDVPESFFEYLRTFRFTGDVWAVPEGTVVFPNEPLLRVSAPLIEAQLLETYLLATINFQTLIASKAARVVDAAGGRGVIEFGSRRAHGMEAAKHAARAAFIGGCVGTSNVEAGLEFGIPVFGTAAHSWVMSFDSEEDSFKAFTEIFPNHTTLLLDTYDTLTAARKAVQLGKAIRGVRLDSGDLDTLSRQVRKILDDGGLLETKIMASGDLDENSIFRLAQAGAPIDLFGVGTELATSHDAPALAGVYKLVEIDGQPRMKMSRDKSTYPFSKQVWREYADDGSMLADTVSLVNEEFPGQVELLEPLMRDGRLVAELPGLDKVRDYRGKQVASLPSMVRSISEAAAFPVRYSAALEAAKTRTLAELSASA